MNFSVQDMDELVKQLSQQYNVDVNLIREVIAQESGGGSYLKASPKAVSGKGAIGLMQLMPGTAADMGVTNSYDWKQNLEGGVKYLSWLQTNYAKDLGNGSGGIDNAKLLAAYNGGIGSVRKYGGVPPFRETRDYVSKITTRLAQSQAANALQRATGTPVVTTPRTESTNGTPTQAATDVTGLQAQANQSADMYAQAANTSTNASTKLGELANNMPDTVAATQQALTGQVNALSALSSQSRNAVDTTFNQLAAQDAAKRQILQSLLTNNNFDPTVSGSVAAVATNNLTNITGRMNATIAAEQEMQDATISSNPGLFLQRMLMGNQYSQGREALLAQHNALKQVTDGSLTTINAQATTAANAKIQDPQLLRDKLNADLALAKMDADVAIKTAETPIKLAEAQTQQIQNIAQIMGYQSSASKDAASATAQSVQTQMDAIKLPYELDNMASTSRTAKANATVAENNADMVSKFSGQTTELKQLELQANTAQQKAAVIEAQQKLDAVTKLAGNNQLSELQVAEANVAYLKAKESVKGLQVVAASNTTVNTAIAQGADAAAAAQLSGLKTAGSQLEYQNKVMEYSKAVGDQLAIQQGVNALGSKAVFNPEKLTVTQKAGITAAAAGQPVASNPALAAKVLLDTGLAASTKYPALMSTVSAIGKLSVTKGADGKPVPIAAMSEQDLSAVPKEKIDSIITNRYANISSDGAIFNPSENPYGLAPPIPDVINKLPEGIRSKYQTAFETVGANAANLSSLDAFSLALSTELDSTDAAADALSAYARASVDYNNSARGYEVIGLQPSKGMNVTFSGLTTYTAKKTFDITSKSDAARYMMLMRTDKAGRALNPGLDFMYNVVN